MLQKQQRIFKKISALASKSGRIKNIKAWVFEDKKKMFWD